MSKSTKGIEVKYVEGVEGNSVYVDDFRVFGQKPWGGGPARYTWTVDPKSLMRDMIRALNGRLSDDDWAELGLKPIREKEDETD